MTDVMTYLQQKEKGNIREPQFVQTENYQPFYELVKEVDNYLLNISTKNTERDWNKIQYLALIGEENGEQEYLQLIEDYLEEHKKKYISFPKWYRNLTEALFHELIGLAGVAEWLYLEKSSTCKVIQPNIYFRSETGEMEIQKQTIDSVRFKRLITTLCHSDYNKRQSDDIIEMVIRKDIRVTIYQNVNKNSSEGTIVFRKYTVQNEANNKGYKFEQLAEKNMFGEEATELFKKMVSCNFNVNFIGAPFTGKTTLLSYYSSYEDVKKEGITIQNVAEFDSTILIPKAPIIDFIINDNNREETKSAILRSDLEYLTYGEVREGDELDLLLFLMSKGITGVKGTYHTAYSPEDFPYLVAEQIQKTTGAELYPTMINAAKGFDFLFETINHPFDKSKKLLKGVYEIQIDPNTLYISSNAICLYDFKTKQWQYNNEISIETKNKAINNNYKAFKEFIEILNELSNKYPLPVEKRIKTSVYSKLIPKY